KLRRSSRSSWSFLRISARRVSRVLCKRSNASWRAIGAHLSMLLPPGHTGTAELPGPSRRLRPSPPGRGQTKTKKNDNNICNPRAVAVFSPGFLVAWLKSLLGKAVAPNPSLGPWSASCHLDRLLNRRLPQIRQSRVRRQPPQAEQVYPTG